MGFPAQLPIFEEHLPEGDGKVQCWVTGLEAHVNLDLSLSFSHNQVDILISVRLTPVTISQLV